MRGLPGEERRRRRRHEDGLAIGTAMKDHDLSKRSGKIRKTAK
jgi:hypothetical protein